jgi:hypothetical protein
VAHGEAGHDKQAQGAEELASEKDAEEEVRETLDAVV